MRNGPRNLGTEGNVTQSFLDREIVHRHMNHGEITIKIKITGTAKILS
jgi:hypothetical protein